MDEAATEHPQVHTAARTSYGQDQGGFRIHFNFPGLAVPDHEDHGYGPLATVVESFLDPGTHIGMHPHRDEEIISWVPAGVMRHEDQTGTELVLDAETLMVMGAGRQFWHAERTLRSDPPLRMLQIFVRPPALGLEPQIDHGALPAAQPDRWRHLFGPTDGDAPLSVRNAVDCSDCRPREGWHTYVYVFEGAVAVGGMPVGYTESALVTGADVTVEALEDATVVAFAIDPDAPVTRQGTIGR
jgi:hypothetical protein